MAAAAGPGHADVTLVITSCDRFDLLERTLASMAPWLDEFPHKILVEDSGARPELFDRLHGRGFRILLNGRRLGQLRSIDRAYDACDTEFVFHCEDDWEFTRKPNVDAARRLLRHGVDGEGRFSMVCFRETTGTKHGSPEMFRERTMHGARFRYAFEHRYVFNCFSFNPGMLRYDLYRRHGPWSRYDDERAIARMMRTQGLCIAREMPGLVRHIGAGRSRIQRRGRTWRRLAAATRRWLDSS